MAGPDHKIWLDVLSYLRAHHPDMCRQWFDDIEPLGASEGVFRVCVAEPVHKRYLAEKCADRFTEALQSVTGHLLSLRFVGAEEALMQRNGSHNHNHATVPAPGAAPRPSSSPRHPGLSAIGVETKPAALRSGATPPSVPSRHEGLVLVPDYTFENFIVGPETRLAHAAALAVCQNPGRTYNPMFIHGGVGLGKTHLLQAMCLRMLAEQPGVNIHYTSCENFINHFMEAVQAGEMNDFRHRFRDVQVLVIDDIHFLTRRDRAQEEFFHTFNELYTGIRQIVLSSDAAPADIPDLEHRLRSRFQCGLVVEVLPPCYDTRVQIVKQKAKIRGLTMPDDVACFIAGRTTSNIRELEGAVVRVQMQANADRSPISLDLARAALGNGPGAAPGTRPEITITNIIDTVVEHYGVKLSDLQSKRRQKSIAHPRQVCMFLARRLTRYSLEEIGGYFGGRDHTTVMHAVRTIDERRAADSEFGRVLASMETRLGGTPVAV